MDIVPIKDQLNATFHNIIAPVAINAITAINPLLGTSLLTAYGFFGVAMQYKQKEVNDFVQILIDNPGIFVKEIVNTKEFQDGFIIFFEEYIKERNQEKRDGIKNIFLGFTTLSNEEKQKFELEKMINTLNIVNENEINLLSLYNLNEIQSEAKPNVILFGKLKSGKALGQNELKQLLNIEYPGKYNSFSKPDMLELINGLINLNLILNVSGGTWDDVGDGSFIITNYGKNFINFIKEYES